LEQVQQDPEIPEKSQRVKAPYWCGKDHYYRRPKSLSEEDISDKELQNRIDFAEASIEARGKKGYVDGMRVSAKSVQDNMTKTKTETVQPTLSPQEIVDREIDDLKRRLQSIMLG